MVYIAIGFFIDRLLAKTYYDKENPNLVNVLIWPFILLAALIYHFCGEWPRALAEYILDWWDIRKNEKKGSEKTFDEDGE
jgi:hypothetical protein